MRFIYGLLLTAVMCGSAFGEPASSLTDRMYFQPTLLDWLVLECQSSVSDFQRLGNKELGGLGVVIVLHSAEIESGEAIRLLITHKPEVPKKLLDSTVEAVKTILANKLDLTFRNITIRDNFRGAASSAAYRKLLLWHRQFRISQGTFKLEELPESVQDDIKNDPQPFPYKIEVHYNEVKKGGNG